MISLVMKYVTKCFMEFQLNFSNVISLKVNETQKNDYDVKTFSNHIDGSYLYEA